MNVGAEAALFPEKEYIKGIFFAVWRASLKISERWKKCQISTFPNKTFHTILL
jgi:hypothetical protein